MTSQRTRVALSKAARRAAAAAATLALAGCSLAADQAVRDRGAAPVVRVEAAEERPIETGSVAPTGATIDPAYADAAARGASGKSDPLEPYSRAAADIAMEEGQLYGATAHLARVFDSDPTDRDVAYNLGRHMRYLGATTEAEQVFSEALRHHPGDALLRLEQAKARIAGGHSDEALEILEPLSRERADDPGVYQALGVAYDRLGRHEEAKAAYATAIGAGAPSAALLNNYGLSFVLSGDLERGIEILRDASVAPGATRQIRNNLAMALALAGRVDEAQGVARSAGPRDSADALVAYFAEVGRSGGSPADAWSVASGE